MRTGGFVNDAVTGCDLRVHDEKASAQQGHDGEHDARGACGPPQLREDGATEEVTVVALRFDGE